MQNNSVKRKTEQFNRRKGGGKVNASPKSDPFGFLKQEIEPLRVIECAESKKFDIAKASDTFGKFGELFLSTLGSDAKYQPQEGVTKEVELSCFIEWFDSELEKFEYSAQYSIDEGEPTIYLRVWKRHTELDYRSVMFPLRSTETLTGKAKELYLRFAAFFVQSTGVGTEFSDEMYFYPLLGYWDSEYEERMAYEEDEEERQMLTEKKEIIDKYKPDGEYGKVFSKVGSLERQDPIKLSKDLRAYSLECKNGHESFLFNVLSAGVEYVSPMYVQYFDYDPDNDGFGDYDEKISLLNTVGICWSTDDEVMEELENAINTDISSGMELNSWTTWIELNERTTVEKIKEFLKDDAAVAEFEEWFTDFQKAEEEYYEFAKRITTEPDGSN